MDLGFFLYYILANLEEFLEMAGVVLFNYTLLRYGFGAGDVPSDPETGSAGTAVGL